MRMKYNGQHVLRLGQKLSFGTKPKTTKQQKEANMKVNLNQQDRARWRRLLGLVELFIKEQQGITEKDGFTLTGEPQTELRLDTQEKNLLTALHKLTVLHFNTGRDVSTIEEFQLPTNAAARQLARDTIERWKDEARSLAAEQPAPAPAVLLAKTESQKRIDKHYEDENNVITNESGGQTYLPPPCILAPLTQAEKEATE